jgi:hypothetical protein
MIIDLLHHFAAGYGQSGRQTQYGDGYESQTQDRTRKTQSGGGQGRLWAEEINVLSFFSILWLRSLIQPLLDGGQTQSDSGAFAGSGDTQSRSTGTEG